MAVILAPGVYPAMSFDEYFSYENVSKHQIDSLARSPAHLRAALDHPRDRTPAMAFGAALHTLVLEPSRFETEYVMLPDDAPPKPNKRQIAAKKPSTETVAAIKWWDEWNVEHAGKTVLNCENGDWDKLHWVRDEILNHPYASILFNPDDGEAEVSIAWVDEETGVYCRARPDFLNQAHALCVDLKTCQDSSMGGFTKAIVNYGYHLQSSMYTDGLAANGRDVHFVFVAVETDPPYATGIYELSPADMELGRTLYKRALRVYQECTETGVWPGYPPHVRIIELPAYARFVRIS